MYNLEILAHVTHLQSTAERVGDSVSPPLPSRTPSLTNQHSVAFPGVYTSCKYSIPALQAPIYG